jgi:hypothetical protein
MELLIQRAKELKDLENSQPTHKVRLRKSVWEEMIRM